MQRCPSRRCKDRIGVIGEERRDAMLPQGLGEGWHQHDVPHGVSSLQLEMNAPRTDLPSYVHQASRKVEVRPGQPKELAATQPGEDCCCKERSITPGFSQQVGYLTAFKKAHF